MLILTNNLKQKSTDTFNEGTLFELQRDVKF